MQILSFYESVLGALNIRPSAEGLLSLYVDDTEIPAMIEDRRLVLPTRDVLRAGNWDGLIAFHPMSENLLRGESPVIRMLKRTANLRMSSIMTDLLIQFAKLGVDSSRHKTIPPKAADVLSAMPGIDEKFVEKLEKILSKQQPNGANRLVSIYLKRGGTFHGQKAARVAVVDFPILEPLEREEDMIFGVSVRKKDRVILDALMKYILPDCDDRETYSAPSQSMSAPYFDALMRAFGNVAYRLNTVVKLHWKMLEQHHGDPNGLLVDLDWMDSFKDLSVFDGQIPALSGNEGEHGGDEEPTPTTVSAPISNAASVFSAAPAKPIAAHAATAKAAETDDRPPWREETKPAASSPFHTERVGQALQQPSGPFHAAPSTVGSADPNKFERPADTAGKKDSFAEWQNRRNQNLQHTQYGGQVQPAPVYGAPPATFGVPYGAIPPQNAPAWAAPVEVVQPGEYRGRVRGVPAHQMGYGNRQTPMWMNPVNPAYGAYSGVAPMGYVGAPVAGPGFVMGGGNSVL